MSAITAIPSTLRIISSHVIDQYMDRVIERDCPRPAARLAWCVCSQLVTRSRPGNMSATCASPLTARLVGGSRSIATACSSC